MKEKPIMIECCEDDCPFLHKGQWGDERLIKHEKMEEVKRKNYKGFKQMIQWEIK